MDYKSSGVDIEAGYRSVEEMRKYVSETMRPEVLGEIGSFSGAFSLSGIKKMDEPVLLSATDGCGTKVKIAQICDRHDTIGIDLVAMCVNDLACAGAEPLIFLDYIACGKNTPEKTARIVHGIADGCVMAGAALIGGETAEHPGLMDDDDYDLAGFSAGICDRKDLITGEDCSAGDALIGLASSGLHSNGYSLVRKVFEDEMNVKSLREFYPILGGMTLGDVLLAPTRIYVKALEAVRKAGIKIKACSHITGGGFYENVPRMLGDGVHAVIKKDSFKKLPIFSMIEIKGDIAEDEMYHTFNMGIGMVIEVGRQDAERAVEILKTAGETPYLIGEVISGVKGVTLC